MPPPLDSVRALRLRKLRALVGRLAAVAMRLKIPQQQNVRKPEESEMRGLSRILSDPPKVYVY